VGPVIESDGPDAGWRPPGRPLVVVSLGTTDMGETPVLQRVLDGLARAPVHVVATVGAHIDPAALRVPENARVTSYVRHAAVLPHADVFVGHGGHGGIMAAFAFGVPVVSLPLDRDQPHNAARVEAVGAGRTVSKDADPVTIADVVESVRLGRRERDGAARMAAAIAAYGSAAVDEVEGLLR
jgi:MGT family glycosyltransferase